MDPTGDFARMAEPFRAELLAHCYRMLGSRDDAEDLVQETYLRAWRSFGAFEGRASVRTWLYRIATNACLTALRGRARRVLPSGLAPPSDDPAGPIGEAPGVEWLQPFPADPAAVAESRAGMRLALIASLQVLPPRQRAVLILRDVLAFPAAEVAGMLDLSVAAVKSALQRARASLADLDAHDELVEPSAPEARALLEQYMTAFENADTALLERVLRQDAALEMVGTPTWFAGIRTCLPFIATPAVIGNPGEWRMLATTANNQPAAVAYRLAGGAYRAFGLAVLTVTATGIAKITVFGEPSLVRRFGFPDVLPPRPVPRHTGSPR
ncbi:sigma-70 family RNA polymerase sigma factor [Amycolatopsis deserti]|uniref:sigma-70 family RNA polymerase sigma factor n=1 Tax=Amycolatopsis deserti TaxID=185696 RepID=UPI003570CA26